MRIAATLLFLALGASVGGALRRPPAWRTALPDRLAEISGLAVDARGRLWAHGDERGEVYELAPRTGALGRRVELVPGARGSRGARGDFEDLAIVGDRLYLLESDGTIHESRGGARGWSTAVRHATGLGAWCREAEGLAPAPDGRALLLVCKRPRPAYDGRLIALAWDPGTKRLAARPTWSVPFDRLAERTGAPRFHASAVLRVANGSRYLLAAGPQRSWAVLDAAGRVIDGGRLSPERHAQPEALALLPDGTLLVGDEAAGGRATLTAYADPTRARGR